MVERTTPHKVYVMLGFHTSFYHSWRGDTPDEAGFGTDIRVVRQILHILEKARQSGREARAYWDFDVYWTLEQILPRHAPDIIDAIRRRVQAGHDEIVLGPYNNGANHAATGRELRTAVSYAIENPFGSGLRQVFGRTSSLFRPQEGMLTAGQTQIYREEGVTGLVLYYAGVPFNCLSTFIPPLPPEQRYGLLRLRCQPDDPPIELWPCISLADLVEETCLEALLLKLRRLQTSGRVGSDLLIHINFDADGEPWLPADVPRAFRWFPNTGGLEEYIDAVNRYPWARFTVPTEYRQDHDPGGEVLVGQDLADGGFDGNYSWAEKYTSLLNWTELERSRLHTYRAEALLQAAPGSQDGDLRRRLWEGTDSVFFRRLIGLSTTHFGMSTPVINEERQARAVQLLGEARGEALAVERAAAIAVRPKEGVSGDALVSPVSRDAQSPTGPSRSREGYQVLYRLQLYRPAVEWELQPRAARIVSRLPLILPPEVSGLRLLDAQGRTVPASLTDGRRLEDDSLAGELLFTTMIEPGERQSFCLVSLPDHEHRNGSRNSQDRQSLRLHNSWLDLRLSREHGVASFRFEGEEIGSSDFLAPFITYDSGRGRRHWQARAYTVESLDGETWDGLSRARISTEIVMDTNSGPAVSLLQYTFTLCGDLPYLLVDVAADYASTIPEHTVDTIQQKLRRRLDLRWIEVAPCQLNPCVAAPAAQPLRVWKHNYLGVVSCYDIGYHRVNPRNSVLDSFNHQVTAGWLAVTNGQMGLLLAENAEVLSSMAFCPMRLRKRDGLQYLSLNPFGSYYGRQLDYGHLGGNRVGAELTASVSGALRPNGPSYNGQRLSFSLLLAPYRGDAPPAQLQADAQAHFYPAGVVFLQTPAGLDLVVANDVRQHVRADARRRQQADGSRLAAPQAVLANPSDKAVDLVWEAPRDNRVTSCEIRWRQAGGVQWSNHVTPVDGRWRVQGLENGRRYLFQLRFLGQHAESDWSREAETVPGPDRAKSLLSAMPSVSPWTLIRLVGYGLAHVIRTRWRRRLD